jgi:hypothetical protein
MYALAGWFIVPFGPLALIEYASSKNDQHHPRANQILKAPVSHQVDKTSNRQNSDPRLQLVNGHQRASFYYLPILSERSQHHGT